MWPTQRNCGRAWPPSWPCGRRQSRSGKAFKHTSIAPDPAVVRAWARSNQYDVPPRGRIPKKIYEAYNAAH